MRVRALVMATVAIGWAGSVMAQPVIIPLGKKPEQPPPSASAPPSAPPMAGPSLPTTNDVAGQSPTVAPSEESASAPTAPGKLSEDGQ